MVADIPSPTTLAAAHGEGRLQLLGGLFGRRHGGRGGLGSGVCPPDGRRFQAGSDSAAAIRPQLKKEGCCGAAGIALGPAMPEPSGRVSREFLPSANQALADLQQATGKPVMVEEAPERNVLATIWKAGPRAPAISCASWGAATGRPAT